MVSKIFRCHNKLTLGNIAKAICLKLNMKPNKYFEKIKLWIKENDNLIELDKKESLKNINTIFWKNSTGLRLYDTDDFFKGVLDKSTLLDNNTNRVLFYSLDYNGLF